jgi:flagellar hook-length control protein FliK
MQIAWTGEAAAPVAGVRPLSVPPSAAGAGSEFHRLFEEDLAAPKLENPPGDVQPAPDATAAASLAVVPAPPPREREVLAGDLPGDAALTPDSVRETAVAAANLARPPAPDISSADPPEPKAQPGQATAAVRGSIGEASPASADFGGQANPHSLPPGADGRPGPHPAASADDRHSGTEAADEGVDVPPSPPPRRAATQAEPAAYNPGEGRPDAAGRTFRQTGAVPVAGEGPSAGDETGSARAQGPVAGASSAAEAPKPAHVIAHPSNADQAALLPEARALGTVPWTAGQEPTVAAADPATGRGRDLGDAALSGQGRDAHPAARATPEPPMRGHPVEEQVRGNDQAAPRERGELPPARTTATAAVPAAFAAQTADQASALHRAAQAALVHPEGTREAPANGALAAPGLATGNEADAAWQDPPAPAEASGPASASPGTRAAPDGPDIAGGLQASPASAAGVGLAAGAGAESSALVASALGAAPAAEAPGRSGEGTLTTPRGPADTGSQIVQAMTSSRTGTIELALQPVELGRVVIEMRPTDGHLAVELTAERPETLELLRRHADQLLRDLREAGYAEVSLDFNGGAGRGKPSHAPVPVLAPFERPPSDDASAAPPPPPPRRGSGALDLRL